MIIAALLLAVPAGDWASFDPERSLAMLGSSADATKLRAQRAQP